MPAVACNHNHCDTVHSHLAASMPTYSSKNKQPHAVHYTMSYTTTASLRTYFGVHNGTVTSSTTRTVLYMCSLGKGTLSLGLRTKNLRQSVACSAHIPVFRLWKRSQSHPLLSSRENEAPLSPWISSHVRIVCRPQSHMVACPYLDGPPEYRGPP